MKVTVFPLQLETSRDSIMSGKIFSLLITASCLPFHLHYAIVILQLRVTRDSICNSCNILSHGGFPTSLQADGHCFLFNPSTPQSVLVRPTLLLTTDGQPSEKRLGLISVRPHLGLIRHLCNFSWILVGFSTSQDWFFRASKVLDIFELIFFLCDRK